MGDRDSHVKSEITNRVPLNSKFREESQGKRHLKNTQLLSPRKKHWTDTVRNRSGSRLSRSGAFCMTHCDFSARSARDEMRDIVGSSEPDVIIGPDKDRNRGRKKKDEDHMEFLCELYEAQVARGR